MRKRGLSKDFLAAMREKMEYGRRWGYEGWDSHWQGRFGHASLRGATGKLMKRLQKEVIELALAIYSGNKEEIRLEAADVANFAMMIADAEGTLDE